MAILGFPTAIMRDRYAVSALLAGRRRGIVLSIQAIPETVTGRADDTRGRGQHRHVGFDRGRAAERAIGAGVTVIDPAAPRIVARPSAGVAVEILKQPPVDHERDIP